MSIAVISSLYRAESHLPAFSAAVFDFARKVSQSGLAVHYLPIVNDATAGERQSIEKLAESINSHRFGRMSPCYVRRESLYATWNRGIALAETPFFSFWNADDIRSADAFIEGGRALQDGATLVDFDFTVLSPRRRLGLFPAERRSVRPMPFNPREFTRKNGFSPFFMASQSLYRQVGAFDEHFRIAGDTDWAGRARAHANFYAARQTGGQFLIHGGNLSNSGRDLEDIEVNIIFMRRGDWHQLRPTDPKAQRAAWEHWGNQADIALPPEVADFLWGASAQKRWRQYQRERRQAPILRRLRLALASRRLIHSVEWSIHERSRACRADAAMASDFDNA